MPSTSSLRTRQVAPRPKEKETGKKKSGELDRVAISTNEKSKMPRHCHSSGKFTSRRCRSGGRRKVCPGSSDGSVTFIVKHHGANRKREWKSARRFRQLPNRSESISLLTGGGPGSARECNRRLIERRRDRFKFLPPAEHSSAVV